MAAAAGNELALRELEGPECPESMRYLLSWIMALHGRSGVGMGGLAPLSWSTLDAWARWTGEKPDAEDLDALFMLDAVMLHPGDGKPKDGSRG